MLLRVPKPREGRLQAKWFCRSKPTEARERLRRGPLSAFLLTARRDLAAAWRFFEQAIGLHGEPEKVTIDKSGANTAAVRGLVADTGLDIELRQSK